MSGAMAEAAIAWLVAAPLLGGPLAFLLGRRGARLVAPLVTALVAASTILLIQSVWRHGPLDLHVGGWAPPLGIALRADGLSAVFVATMTVVWPTVGLYAVGYLRRAGQAAHGNSWLFWPLWMLLWAGMNAAFLSADLFNLYVAIEVLALSAVALVGLAGAGAVVAAARYALVTLVGSLFYLLGVGLIYGVHGVVDLAAVAELAEATPATAAAAGLMTVGLLLKTAIVPLHFWLAPAHGGALAPISALLSGLVVKASFYVLVRLWVTVFAPVVTSTASELLGVLGAVAIVWGGAQALVQARLKMLVAYSTVSQLGYLLLVFPLAEHPGSVAWAGAVMFVIAHAIAKPAMFLAAGAIRQATGADELASLGGIANRLPAASFAFALSGIALIGLPPSGGFIAKWLLLTAAIEAGRWSYVIVISVGTLLAIAYVFRVIAATMRAKEPPLRGAPVGAIMQVAAFALAVLAMGLGLLVEPPMRLLDVGHPFGTSAEVP